MDCLSLFIPRTPSPKTALSVPSLFVEATERHSDFFFSAMSRFLGVPRYRLIVE